MVDQPVNMQQPMLPPLQYVATPARQPPSSDMLPMHSLFQRDTHTPSVFHDPGA